MIRFAHAIPLFLVTLLILSGCGYIAGTQKATSWANVQLTANNNISTAQTSTSTCPNLAIRATFWRTGRRMTTQVFSFTGRISTRPQDYQPLQGERVTVEMQCHDSLSPNVVFDEANQRYQSVEGYVPQPDADGQDTLNITIIPWQSSASCASGHEAQDNSLEVCVSADSLD